MSEPWFWSKLGIAAGSDVAAIRRSYAEKLKAMDIDADPQGFMALRRARDAALSTARDSAEPGPADGDVAAPPVSEYARSQPADDIVPGGVFSLDCGEAPAGAISVARPKSGENEVLLRLDLPDAASADAMPSARTLIGPLRAPSQPLQLARPWLGGGEVQAFFSVETQAGKLEALLRGPANDEEVSSPLTAQEEAQADRYLDNLLADRRLQDVDFYSHVEQWFAGMFARTTPRSDPLLAKAVSFFRWEEQSKSIHASATVQYLVRRHRDVQFVYALQNPSHQFHEAWLELRRPADATTTLGFALTRPPVQSLLAAVRSHYPGVEQYFDRHRVVLWDRKQENSFGGIGWGTAALGVFMLISVCARIAAIPEASAPTPQGQSAYSEDGTVGDGQSGADSDPARTEAEMKLALAAIAPTLDLAELRRRQPQLVNLMNLNHRIYQADKEPERYVAGMAELLRRRIALGLRRADYRLLVAFQTNQRAVVKFLLAKDPKECVAMLQGKPVTLEKLPDGLRRATGSIQGRVLVETDGDQPETSFPTSFTVSGNLVGAAIDSVGMDEADFRAGMSRKGSARTQCRTALALLNAALAAPRAEGMTILRALT